MSIASMSMTTMREEHGQNAAYWGDCGDWLIAAAQHRDSDTITRANWAGFVEALGSESDTVRIERSNHWAVGWVEYLIIDPADSERVKVAEELRASLEDYPVLDDMALSNLEYEEYQENWRNFGASDFCDELARAFQLNEATKDFLSECDQEALQEWFESLITSGEYYIAEGDSVYPNIKSAVWYCTREALAAFLRGQRKAVAA